MNKKYIYIKEASPFGSLRQILRILPPDVREYDYHGGFDSRGYELAKQKYEKEIAGNPLYPLSTQPSEQWIERKEYQEGVDFKFSYEEIINDPLYHTASIIQSNHPLSAIPIEKKDDLVASQNHPQPLDSVATLACTDSNSIEQWIKDVINGVGGFKDYENYEFVAFADRDEGIAGFVIRCLANPTCEGSEEVLNAIIEKRKDRMKMLNSEQEQERSVANTPNQGTTAKDKNPPSK
jgi:hypothetical protein